MAKRKLTMRIPSTEVQGEGSYVEFAALTYGESKAIVTRVDDTETDSEKIAINERLLIEKIVGWNWVDENDNPLPLPKDDPTVLDTMPSWEMTFLNVAFRDEVALKKK